MFQTDQVRECFGELDKLRATLMATQRTPNDDLLESATEMAQNQLSSLRTINDFVWNFSTNSTLKDRLQFDNRSIVMPGRSSVLNLVEASKAALEIHKEVARKESDSIPDKDSLEAEKANLNRLACADYNNQEFSRCFKNIVQHYSGQSEVEDFGNITVNTFASDEILASSPF